MECVQLVCSRFLTKKRVGLRINDWNMVEFMKLFAMLEMIFDLNNIIFHVFLCLNMYMIVISIRGFMAHNDACRG